MAVVKCSCDTKPAVLKANGRVRCPSCGSVHSPLYPEYGSMPVAGKKSWRLKPAPSALVRRDVSWKFSKADLVRMSWGAIPATQDDKWFIYQSGKHIFFHRSWTGMFCYRAKLEGSRIVQIAIAKSLIKHESIQAQALIKWLIVDRLLGRPLPFPKRS